jgi:hypothetical protein
VSAKDGEKERDLGGKLRGIVQSEVGQKRIIKYKEWTENL